MKHTFYFLCLLFAILLFCSWANAQNPTEEHFYYYKDEKIVLNVDYSRIFIVSKNEYTLGDRFSVHGITFTVDNCWNVSMNQYSFSNQADADMFYTEIVTPKNISNTEYFNAIQTIQEYADVIKASPFYSYLGKKTGISNNFYVKLSNEHDFETLSNLATKYSIKILGNNEFMPLWFTLSCVKETPLSSLEAANMFYELQLFEYSEPELLYYDLLSSNDEYFSNQWGLKNTGQYGGISEIDINVEKAWEITTGTNAIISIFDHGFEMDHPDLRNNVYGTGYDATTNTTPAMVRGAHGTACAGIAGAQQNNIIGISGVAPNAKLMSISIRLNLFADKAEQIANGFNWAWQNGADIISCSWGGYKPSSIIDDAITSTLTYGRNGKGTVIVFSSGNIIYPYRPYPGDSNPDIIVVGAISPCGERKSASSCDGEYWGSCYGFPLDVMAPGVLISTTDRQGAEGYNNGNDTNDYLNSDYHKWFNGTSAACPHVAGVAALVLSVNPDLTVQQVQEIINSTAQKTREDLYLYVTDSLHPNGRWNHEMGYGLVDAYEAVRKAICNDTLPIVSGIVTQNTTWNTPLQAVNVVVPNGVELTITSEVRYASSLTVQPGGKLIIDGGIITNSCDSTKWEGIIVQGNLKKPHIQGVVELRNGGTIENAKLGIHAVTGGIVQATDARFFNNRIAVHIDMASEGTFTNSEFIINDDYFGNPFSFPEQLIINNSGKLVEVLGCTFSNNATRGGYPEHFTTAISAFNSDLTVKDNSNGISTTFSGFRYGISVNNSGASPKLMIHNCIFSDNLYAIQLNAVNAPSIKNNIFTLSRPDAYGLYTYESTGYIIEENEFTSTDKLLPTTGIIINKSGSAENEIYKNDFLNLNVGIQAIDQNSSQCDLWIPSKVSGLQFFCNVFKNIQQTDILVGANYFADHSVRKNQGDLLRPAGNKFTGNYRVNIRNYSNYPISYYYSNFAPDEIPYATVGAVNNMGLNIVTDCPVHRGKSELSLVQYDEWNEAYQYWLAKWFAVCGERFAVNGEEECEDILQMVSYYSALKDNYFNKIIVAVMENETVDPGVGTVYGNSRFETLRFLYRYRENYTDYLSIIETYIAENKYGEALATLSQMYRQFEITEEDKHELYGLEIYIHWLQQLEDSQNSIYTLTEKNIKYLVNYVETNSGRGVVFAKNILCVLYNICIEEEVVNGKGQMYNPADRQPSSVNVTCSPCDPISAFPWTERFENNGTEIPPCWTNQIVDDFQWEVVPDSIGIPNTAHEGSYKAQLFYSSAAGVIYRSKLITPIFDLSTVNDTVLNFWHTRTEYGGFLSVYYKNSPSGTWTLLKQFLSPIPDWQKETISLPERSDYYQIAFEGTFVGSGTVDIQLDDIFISDSETKKSAITASAGANGTIIPEGIIIVNQNENISFTFTPNENYVVDSLWVDNIYISDSIHSYTFENVSANHTIYVTFATVVSIETYNSESNIVLYPNPTTGELRIENGELRIENVEIFDVYGRTILHSPFSILNSIDISHLEAGIYFIKIITDHGNTVKKIVKL